MFCGCCAVIKKGTRLGVTRYQCAKCNRSFSSKRRIRRTAHRLWNQYVHKRQTLHNLAEQEGCSAKTIQRILKQAATASVKHAPRPIVLVADATYFCRGEGMLIGKDPHQSEVVYRAEIHTETALAYGEMRHALERLGYGLRAVVIDGKRGIPEVFRDIPIQLCQFHQIQTVRRKLTLRPKTQAGVELLDIGLHVTRYTAKTLHATLEAWYERHRMFLEEKTFCAYCRRNHYTHRRVRGAYRSLLTNCERLFTFQRYPHLNIPNTTNCLDGLFSALKEKLGVHRGYTKEKRAKIVQTLLGI